MNERTIVFYEAPMSSATPVSTVLAELAVPHERVRLDLKAGEQKQASFLELNPNGKVPTLLVGDTPMFESLAIMLWLADTYGVPRGVWPELHDPKRLEALSWSTWAYVSLGTAIGNQYRAKMRGETPDHTEVHQLLGILDARLAKKGGHVLGKEFSIADMIVGNVVGWGAASGVPVKDFRNVVAWMETCRARPSMSAWAS